MRPSRSVVEVSSDFALNVQGGHIAYRNIVGLNPHPARPTFPLRSVVPNILASSETEDHSLVFLAADAKRPWALFQIMSFSKDGAQLPRAFSVVLTRPSKVGFWFLL